jgi:hypothetical protein
MTRLMKTSRRVDLALHYQSIHPSIHPSIHLSTHPSIYLPDFYVPDLPESGTLPAGPSLPVRSTLWSTTGTGPVVSTRRPPAYGPRLLVVIRSSLGCPTRNTAPAAEGLAGRLAGDDTHRARGVVILPTKQAGSACSDLSTREHSRGILVRSTLGTLVV